MPQLSPILQEQFEKDGFVVLPGAVSGERIDELLGRFLGLVAEESGRSFDDALGPELAAVLAEHPDVERSVYDEIRRRPWLEEFALHPELTDPIRELLGDEAVLLGKIPFRIDLPRLLREVAWWHQDHFYVRGSTRIVTAWVPMQDTTFVQGALSVMPGSHLLGAVDHDIAVGKRKVAGALFDRDIRLVEMRRGDLLLFDALLLHSGNVNLSDTVRYSIQARYSPPGQPVDPGMGAPVAIS
jgi:ectoine hydroxylase